MKQNSLENGQVPVLAVSIERKPMQQGSIYDGLTCSFSSLGTRMCKLKGKC